LQLQQRRGTVRIEAGGVELNAGDLDSDASAYFARHLRSAIEDADVRTGDRVQITIQFFAADGTEIVVHARRKAA
jgi:hypothetical protein